MIMKHLKYFMVYLLVGLLASCSYNDLTDLWPSGNDVEEEIEGINDKVQKRIDKLKYEYHEERRAKEAADRLREEAVNYAQKIQGENKRLSALINKGEEALLGQISAKSTAELEKAKAEFKEAYEAGNSDAMLAANEKILAAQVDLKSATEKLNYYHQAQVSHHHYW